MAYRCDIKARAARRLRNNWNEVLLEPGDEFTITAIHCHNGPYSCVGGPRGRFTVPRSWLVECGALEPLPISEVVSGAEGTPA